MREKDPSPYQDATERAAAFARIYNQAAALYSGPIMDEARRLALHWARQALDCASRRALHAARVRLLYYQAEMPEEE